MIVFFSRILLMMTYAVVFHNFIIGLVNMLSFVEYCQKFSCLFIATILSQIFWCFIGILEVDENTFECHQHSRKQKHTFPVFLSSCIISDQTKQKAKEVHPENTQNDK